MNKKGQALVEFVLILPILIFILLSIIDISKIMIMKNHLESVLGTIDINSTSVNDLEYDIKFKRDDSSDEVVITLESCIEITTPGLNKILGDPACVETTKIIKKNEG